MHQVDSCVGPSDSALSVSDETELVADQLAFLTRRMSRALLRHPQRDTFNSHPSALFAALHHFFAEWSDRQHRAAAMRLTLCATHSLLRRLEGVLVSHCPSLRAMGPPPSAIALLSAAPPIPIGDISVPIASIAPLLELARHLDAAHRLRTPIGAINAMHLLALGATLCPAESVGALLRGVAAALTHRTVCAAVVLEWAALDQRNAAALRALAEHVERGAGGNRSVLEVVTELLDGPFVGLCEARIDALADSPVGMGDGTPQRSEMIEKGIEEKKRADGVEHDPMNGEKKEEEEEEEDDVNSGVDVDFWRRLCS